MHSYIFVSMLLGSLSNMVLAFPSNLHRPAFKGETNSTETVADHVFDYIVCGGGLTGLTVASRLTEDPHIKVLVIEEGYGNHEDRRVNDVRTYGEAFNAELDHGLRSTPVKWQNGSEQLLVAGKMLGGSGSLNGASWTKGAKSQYNLLPTLTGDDSWGWKGLEGYMQKAEHFNRPSDAQRDEKGAHYNTLSHGYNGPVQVSFGAEMFGGSQLAALEASEKVWRGLSRNSDAASGVTTGATIIPNMVYPDEMQNRPSPFTAYAKQQVQDRPNFVILTGHRVTEIVWNGRSDPNDKLVASGVRLQASKNATAHFVAASREVLLAAGSLQSPQLLELSGVGHPDVLSAAGIEVRHAMPGIGKNMQEQTKNTITFNARAEVDFDGTGPPSAISFPDAAQVLGSPERAMEVYIETKANLAEFAAELEKSGLVNSAQGTHTILEAQLDNLFNASDAAAAEVFFTITPASDNTTEQQDAYVGIDNWNLIVLSRGTVHINTSSAWDYPVVEPSYFLHPLDLLFQTEINKQSRQVFNTAPLADFVETEHTPGLQTVPDNADHKQWEDWVKKTFTSVWHYIGSISMMKEELGGSVDSRLKLYGIENVRVVDASVLPIQLSAHLSSSLYGIAEKAADMIKEDQRSRQGGAMAHRKKDSRNTLEQTVEKS